MQFTVENYSLYCLNLFSDVNCFELIVAARVKL